MLREIDTNWFADQMELCVDNESVTDAGIANQIRHFLSRRQLSRRRDVINYVKEQVGIVESIDASSVKRFHDVLAHIAALGECENLLLGDERYIASAMPRWIRTAKTQGSVLYAGILPKSLDLPILSSGNEVVRRVRVASEGDVAKLTAHEIRECEFSDWIGQPDFVSHASRRSNKVLRRESVRLSDFWDILVSDVESEGQPLSPDAEVRTLSGPPGGKFGKYLEADRSGRWTDTAGDGVWCAYRRAYGERQWHPIIMSVHGDHRLSLDLFDHDEWKWAILARGKAMGDSEKIVRKDGLLFCTFPPTRQLALTLDLLGARKGGWSWSVPPDSHDLWSVLLGCD